MTQYQYLPVIVIFCILTLTLNATSLEMVKAIGDDRDEYFLIGVADAIITDDNQIWILDSNGNFISHFDWEGKFIKKIGRTGQGPGDFYLPYGLDYYEGKIYVMDKGNKRIVEIGVQDGKMEFYKDPPGYSFNSRISVLPGDFFLGYFSHAAENRGRFGIIDKKGKLILNFFNEYPIPMKPMELNPNGEVSVEKVTRSVLIDQHSRPTFDITDDRKKILISFMLPDNPILFFVFDLKGQLLKKFSYTIEEKQYRYPDFYITGSIEKLRNPGMYPDLYIPEIEAVAFYGDHYVAFLNLTDFKKGKMVKRRRYCLVFDSNGKPVQKFAIEDISILRHSRGYFLGVFTEDENVKVGIYKIKIH